MKLLLVWLCMFAGCATPLFESNGAVSIYVVGTPSINVDGTFSIVFKFKSPVHYSHLIQEINFDNAWSGVESFRVNNDGDFALWQIDHHYDGITSRDVTIMPGIVSNADEAIDGFAMLPANWPPHFNEQYASTHEIKGYVKARFPQFATRYQLYFNGKQLRFKCGSMVREWGVTSLVP